MNATPIGGSISAMLHRVESRNAAAAQQQSLFQAQPEARPIDQAQLTQVWRAFAQQLPDIEAYMQSQMDVEPIANGNEVKVMVHSKMQAESLATNAELVGYLKQKLANPSLIINAIIDQSAAKEVKVVYTLDQRMNYFKEKNKYFGLFVEKFNLEASF